MLIKQFRLPLAVVAVASVALGCTDVTVGNQNLKDLRQPSVAPVVPVAQAQQSAESEKFDPSGFWAEGDSRGAPPFYISKDYELYLLIGLPGTRNLQHCGSLEEIGPSKFRLNHDTGDTARDAEQNAIFEHVIFEKSDRGIKGRFYILGYEGIGEQPYRRATIEQIQGVDELMPRYSDLFARAGDAKRGAVEGYWDFGGDRFVYLDSAHALYSVELMADGAIKKEKIADLTKLYGSYGGKFAEGSMGKKYSFVSLRPVGKHSLEAKLSGLATVYDKGDREVVVMSRRTEAEVVSELSH